LEEETTFGDSHWDLLPVPQPYIQPRVSRLPVNCKEGNIVVEASKGSADIIANEIRSGRSQEMSTSLHSLCESIGLESHTNGSHLGCCGTSLKELRAPPVHLLLPVRESLLWDNLREIIIGALRAFTDFPHISPLHVHSGWEWRKRLVFLRQVLDFFEMVTSSLNLLRGNTDLEVVLRLSIGQMLTRVIAIGGSLEVSFHEIDVIFVLLLVGSGVSEDQNAVLVKTVSHLLAFLFPARLPLKEGLDVDNWHLFY
jgi:hypothetical protein